MTFKPFLPGKYLFIMTLTVRIKQCEKVNSFKPKTPQGQTHRFESHSPYCPVARLNGPRAYIRTPLYLIKFCGFLCRKSNNWKWNYFSSTQKYGHASANIYIYIYVYIKIYIYIYMFSWFSLVFLYFMFSIRNISICQVTKFDFIDFFILNYKFYTPTQLYVLRHTYLPPASLMSLLDVGRRG